MRAAVAVLALLSLSPSAASYHAWETWNWQVSTWGFSEPGSFVVYMLHDGTREWFVRTGRGYPHCTGGMSWMSSNGLIVEGNGPCAAVENADGSWTATWSLTPAATLRGFGTFFSPDVFIE